MSVQAKEDSNLNNSKNSNNLDFSIDKNGVANLVFNLPNDKVNKLSTDVLLELEKAINIIDGNKAIRVLLISSGKNNNFIAGADINEIKAINTENEAMEKVSRGQLIIGKLAKLRIPTIAVVSGSCLGGGLELILACSYRVAIFGEKTSFGLPEVNLGIIPGFGGTQRLPKLVGLEESLKIILTGKAVDALKAYKIGLVDDVIHNEFLEEKLSEFVSEILLNGVKNRFLQQQKQRKKVNFIKETLLLKKFLVFYFAKKDLWQKTKGRYLAPFYALEVIRKTYGKTYGKNGYKTELKAFCELAVGDISKNLIDVFFTSEAIKKDSGISSQNYPESGFEKKEIKTIGLLGAGVMGGGIAWLFAKHDIFVRIKDITQNAIALGMAQVQKIFLQLQKIKKIKPSEIALKTSKISAGTDFAGFEKADLIIEAVIENMAIKKNILHEVEQKVSKDTILASNTSSLSVSEMAGALSNPERFAGMHFFNPVNLMPLVEVIRGEKTDDKTIATIVSLAKKLGKTPIVVKDVAGFLVNRILLPYLNEAAFILQQGVKIDAIDRKIEEFGMPMGPFILADTVGIDVGYKVANSLFEAYGTRMTVAKLISELHQNYPKLLGKKSNIGFYIHKKGDNSPIPNQQIYEIIEKISEESDATIKVEDEEITERCIFIMINEAARCIDEKVVASARYLDLAMIMGTGFPAFRGGLLKYADKLGIENVVNKLKRFELSYGQRFKPCDLLVSMSRNQQKFYN